MHRFVYAVCGERYYIETLNFSLAFLRKFSNYPIWIITDSARNEIPISHNNIVDIRTPVEYNNHQASIFLKTGLSIFLPKMEQGISCYLDSDVIVLGPECNNIFHNYNPPVSFAPDHCAFGEYSPHAFQCSCEEEFVAGAETFRQKIKGYFPDFSFDSQQANADLKKLTALFGEMKKHPLRNTSTIIRYLIARYIFPVEKVQLGEFVFMKKNRCWYNANNEMISFDNRYHRKKLWKKHRIFFNNGDCYDENHRLLTPRTAHCTHLSEYLKKKYGVDIPTSWRHWNGGVFLFDFRSEEFMKCWHNTVQHEFSNSLTKTRDQSALAMCVWKNHLEQHPTLPVAFNFITGIGSGNIRWNADTGYSTPDANQIPDIHFLHVCNRWGDASWDIWQSVLSLAAREGIEMNGDAGVPYSSKN